MNKNIAPALFASLLYCGGVLAATPAPDMEIDIRALERTVRFLASIRPPRNHENVESLDKAARHIHDTFTAYGLAPEEQPYAVFGRTYKNIVANVGPGDAPKVIVGAHYDVFGDQPGADDNAGAVAGLLEIARFAKRNEKALKYNMEFVAYTLEEPPNYGTASMGSHVHAEKLHNGKDTVKAMICLEMIGYFSEKENSQQYPPGVPSELYPKKGNFIAVVGNGRSGTLVNDIARSMMKASIDVVPFVASGTIDGVDFSDHVNYWKYGYSAVMITDTAYYRNPSYHTLGDTVDTLSFGKMREVVKGVCLAILDLQNRMPEG